MSHRSSQFHLRSALRKVQSRGPSVSEPRLMLQWSPGLSVLRGDLGSSAAGSDASSLPDGAPPAWQRTSTSRDALLITTTGAPESSWLALLEFDSERCVVHMRYGRMWFLAMMMIWAPFFDAHSHIPGFADLSIQRRHGSLGNGLHSERGETDHDMSPQERHKLVFASQGLQWQRTS